MNRPRLSLTRCVHKGVLLGALIWSADMISHAQQTSTISRNQLGTVSQISVPEGQTYHLPNNRIGSIWVALDKFTLMSKKAAVLSSSEVSPGSRGLNKADVDLALINKAATPSRLIAIHLKPYSQEPIISHLYIQNSLEDASARNETLLIAISECHLSDIKNIGDEGEWKPQKSADLILKPGSIAWLQAGIHHLKNLRRQEAELVLVEW